MSESATGQVIASAAEVYEEFFVPALFQQWPSLVAGAAQLEPGERVLDVACGTGVLTRHLVGLVGPDGTVVGLDVNERMLAVAKRKAPAIEWRQGRAEELPFDAGSFDAVVSQFALMFFEDRQSAIREMVRVLRPGGRLAVAVWGTIESSTGYAELAGLLKSLFGDEAANALRAPFRLGDVQALRSLFNDAGLANVQITTHEGTARFPSIDAWIFTEIRGWTLADMLDDSQYEMLLAEAKRELRPFTGEEGKVAFGVSAHIASAIIG
jgi:ubiquinone/menaquinone biosynthesis C-methylase UbiE